MLADPALGGNAPCERAVTVTWHTHAQPISQDPPAAARHLTTTAQPSSPPGQRHHGQAAGDRPTTVSRVTQPAHTHPPTLRLWAAIALGVTGITASVLLIATDAITGSSHWAHHAGISAAPLLLIAAAIAAAALAQPPHQRRRLMPLIAALAFTAWGLAQLLPSSTAAGYLNDTAILLFVTDAAYAIAANARNTTPPASHIASEPANPTHTPQPDTKR